MSISVRYLILKSSDQQLMDFRTSKAKYTLDGVTHLYGLNGKEYSVTGSAVGDNIWVAPGSKVDASALLGGADSIYLGGRWSDYTKTIDSANGTLTFSREVGGKVESVTVGNGLVNLTRDSLVFADGTIDTRNARLALMADSSATPALDASRTSQAPFVPGPQTGDTFVRALSRESGVNFVMPTVGLNHRLAGSAGIDQIYVTPGATVDAVALLGGTDRVFLTGKWSDYTKTLAPENGAIVFTREINGQIEKVSVANGLIGLSKDLVVFADGAARTDTIRLALASKGPNATVDDLFVEGAKTADQSDDWTDRTFTRWGAEAPEITAVAGDDRVDYREREAGVTVRGSAEPGSLVKLVWGGVAKEVIADVDGKWSATFAGNEVPANGASTLTATATDTFGNVSAVSSRSVIVNVIENLTAPIVDEQVSGSKIDAVEAADGTVVKIP
ncbi:hypothetical protein SAMN05660489_06398, partial [Pseudomonas sp. LAMO17WK12:I10]|uniref:hypothetical protein n=1 Tax=unclassified Pseudomonas TaxID=196821 RepID=UPI000BD6A68A